MQDNTIPPLETTEDKGIKSIPVSRWNRWSTLVQSRRWEPYLLLLPAILFLIIFLGYPTLSNIYYSLWNWKYTAPDQKTFIGLLNYINLFTKDRLFWQAFGFTLRYVFFTLAIEFILAMAVALLLNSMGRWANIIAPILVLPYMTARLAVGLTWRLLWARGYGLLYYLLGFVGLGDINWLGNPDTAFYAVTIPEIWRSMPFMMLILLAGLASISDELYEAGKLDGGSSWQLFRYITLPLLMPSIAVGLIFQSIFKLRVFDLVFIMTGGGPGTATLPLGILIYRTYLRYLQGGYSAALSVVLLVMGGVFAFVYMRVLLREN